MSKDDTSGWSRLLQRVREACVTRPLEEIDVDHRISRGLPNGIVYWEKHCVICHQFRVCYAFRKLRCGDPEHRITLSEINSIKTDNNDGYTINSVKYYWNTWINTCSSSVCTSFSFKIKSAGDYFNDNYQDNLVGSLSAGMFSFKRMMISNRAEILLSLLFEKLELRKNLARCFRRIWLKYVWLYT